MYGRDGLVLVVCTECMDVISLVPRPTSQLRMDYITATRVVGLVSSCTNFCPAIT